MVIQNESQQEIQTLQFAMGDKDIEIERMQTTLMALNEKLNVRQDVFEDITVERNHFKMSEEERGKLQVHMENTSRQIN